MLTTTAAAALTNCTVAASASSRSSRPAARRAGPSRRCGVGSLTIGAGPPPGATSGGSMKYATLYIMNGASSSHDADASGASVSPPQE